VTGEKQFQLEWGRLRRGVTGLDREKRPKGKADDHDAKKITSNNGRATSLAKKVGARKN